MEIPNKSDFSVEAASRPPDQFDPEGSGYDYETAKKYGITPDEQGKWISREPTTGQILKGKTHPTWDLTAQEEQKAGYEIYKGYGGKYYSRPVNPGQKSPDIETDYLISKKNNNNQYVRNWADNYVKNYMKEKKGEIRPETVEGAIKQTATKFAKKPGEPTQRESEEFFDKSIFAKRTLFQKLLDDVTEPAGQTGKTMAALATGYGPVEAGAQLITGIPAFIVSGITQGIEAISPGSTKNIPFEVINKIAESLMYEPMTEAGQQLVNALSAGFQYPKEIGPLFADWIREKTGSPVLATAGGTALAGLPEILMGLFAGRAAIKSGGKFALVSKPKEGLRLPSVEDLTAWDERISKGLATEAEKEVAIKRAKQTKKAPGDLAADAERINLRLHDEMQGLYNKIPPEEWDRVYREKGIIGKEDVEILVENAKKRLEPKMADELEANWKRIDNIGKEAELKGLEVELKPEPKGIEARVQEALSKPGFERTAEDLLALKEKGPNIITAGEELGTAFKQALSDAGLKLKSERGAVTPPTLTELREMVSRGEEGLRTLIHYARRAHEVLRGSISPEEMNSYSREIRRRWAQNIDTGVDYPYIPSINTYPAGSPRREPRIVQGRIAHALVVPESQIYDGITDPLRLWSQARDIVQEKGYTENIDLQRNVFDNLIVRAGYPGAMVRIGDGPLERTIYLFGEREAFTPQTYGIGVSREIQGLSRRYRNLEELMRIGEEESKVFTKEIKGILKEFPELKIGKFKDTFYRGAESSNQLERSKYFEVEGPLPSVEALAARVGTRYGQNSVIIFPAKISEAGIPEGTGVSVKFKLKGTPSEIERNALTAKTLDLNIVKEPDGYYVDQFLWHADDTAYDALIELHRRSGEGDFKVDPSGSQLREKGVYEQTYKNFYGGENYGRFYEEDLAAAERYKTELQRMGRQPGEESGGGGYQGPGGYTEGKPSIGQPAQVYGREAPQQTLTSKERLLSESGYFSPVAWKDITDAYERAKGLGDKFNWDDIIPFKREKSSGRYIGSPTDLNIDTPAKFDKYLAKLIDLAIQGADARYWYENSGLAILKFVGGNVGRAQKLIEQIANMSPLTDVALNLEYGLNSFYHLERGLPFKAGLFPGMVRKATEIFHGEGEVSGQKVSAFYSNLMHAIDPIRFPEGTVTNDSWMQRGAGYTAKGFLSQTQDIFLGKAIQRIALQLGWKPHQVQAAMWSAIKAKWELTNDVLTEAAINKGLEYNSRSFFDWINQKWDKTSKSFTPRQVADYIRRNVEDFDKRLESAGFIPPSVSFEQSNPADFFVSKSRGVIENAGSLPSGEANLQFFKSPRYHVGYSLSKNGHISNLFDVSNERGAMTEAILDAISRGAKTVDFFEGPMEGTFKQLGFEITERRPFDERFIEQGWDPDVAGRPRIFSAEYRGPRYQNLGTLRRKILGPEVPWHPEGAFGTSRTLEEVPGRSYEGGVMGAPESISAMERLRKTSELGAPLEETPRTLGEIARDLKTIIDLDERGSISFKELSPDKQAAYNRLQKDFQAIMRNAKRVGKTIDQYLMDLGVDREIIQYIAEKTRQGQEPMEEIPGSKTDIKTNLDRIGTTEAVKDIIADVEREQRAIGRIEETTRGIRHHEQTIAASKTKARGLTLEDILTREPGEIWNAEQLTSARDIRTSFAEKVDAEVESILKGDLSRQDHLVATFGILGEIVSQVTGGLAEAGRAVEAAKILSEGGRQYFDYKQLGELAQAVKLSVGDPVLLARRIKALKTPEQKYTFAQQLVNGAKMGRDIFNYVWINGLLSGPPSHIVNFATNGAAFVGGIATRYLAEQVGRVREFIGGEPGVQLGEANIMLDASIHSFIDSLKAAKTAWVDNQSSFGKSTKTEYVRNPLSREALGLTDSYSHTVEFLANTVELGGDIIGGPGRGLLVGDEFWKTMNYKSELKARALREAKMEGLTGKAFEERVKYIYDHPDEFPAINEAARSYAEYQTFTQQLGRVGQAVQSFANATPLTKIILPFVKTPSNIIKYTQDYTPALNMMSKRFYDDVFVAGGDKADLALAKMSIGILTVASTMYLASQGLITGNGPHDKKLRNIWLQDSQPYSIKIGENWIAYNRMDFPGNIIGIAADTSSMVNELDLHSAEQIFAALAVVSSNIFVNKTYLKGLADTLEAIKEPEKGSEQYVRNWMRSLVPSVVRLTNTSYFDPAIRELESVFDGIKAGVPGMSEGLPPKRNFWGDPIYTPGTLGPEMLSPYRLKKQTYDPVNEEILANGLALSMPPKWIGGSRPSENILLSGQERYTWGIKLTPEQYDRFVLLARKEKIIGNKNLYNRLEDLIKTENYLRQSQGPDGGRALMIRGWISEYTEVAKQKLMEEFPELKDQIRNRQIERAQMMRPTY